MAMIPKHDELSEQWVLWSCIIDKNVIPYVLSDIQEDYFYIDNNKIVFKAIKSLAEKWKTIDLITLKNALESQDISVTLNNWKKVIDKFKKENLLEEIWGISYLTDLTEAVWHTVNIYDYTKIMKENYLLRQYSNLWKYISDWLKNNLDTSWVADLIERQLKVINSMWIDDKTEDMMTIMTDHYESLLWSLEWNEWDIKRVKTWFTELDKQIWALHWWDLVVVAASSSIGKTMFSINVLNNITWQWNKWLLFTMEMSKNKISDILITINSDIKYQTLQTWNDDVVEMRNKLLLAQDRLDSGIDTDDNYIKTIQNNINILVARKQKVLEDSSEAIDAIAERKLYIDDRSGLTTKTIRNKIMELSVTGDLDIVVVDQLSLMSGNWAGIRERYDIITWELKQMAREYNVPIVLVVQLLWKEIGKRAGHVPRNDDIKESFKIYEDADKVLLLNRPSFWAQEDWHENDEFSDMSMHVHITKNRWWSTSEIILWCDIEHQRLRNATSLEKSKHSF